MYESNTCSGRLIAAVLVGAMMLPVAAAHAATPPQAAGERLAQAASSQATAQQDAAKTEAELALPDNPSPVQQQQPAQQPQDATPPAPQQPQAQPQQNGDSKPVGTAAAPYNKTLGVPASRPAGAVIAPAKQKRVRTIWISVAAVVGAGIAVGSVVGLSKASSSRP